MNRIPELSSSQQVWRGLLYAQRSMFLRHTSELKATFGLTPAQFEALLTLWECPELRMRMSDLSQALLYSSGSATHLVGQLQKQGWVDRTTDPADARAVLVSLTSTGATLIEQARDRNIAQIRAEFEPLVDADDLASLLAFVRRFAEAEGVTTTP